MGAIVTEDVLESKVELGSVVTAEPKSKITSQSAESEVEAEDEDFVLFTFP